MSNRLEREKSPYLLQHKENPVNWYPWSEDAFRKAKEEDKPIFLSIGYSTCHWCHVMAHESFEDPEAAAVLNGAYISIKVDREERPDIDAVYMAACQAVTGSGGWPLTILMTPEQKPFFTGTYLPKHNRYGQMGLIELLTKAATLWRTDRKALLAAGNQITEAVSVTEASGRREPNRDLLHRAYHRFARTFDSQWGGFGKVPKFPTPHNLLFLLHYAEAEGQKDALAMAEVALEAMAKGGIQDHVGGGFSRYSTDRQWLVPHFEKMLYDNALLLLTYAEAYQVTGNVLYARTAEATGDYILRELMSQEGGCFCGQDADSDGVEGKYYVFTKPEVVSVLGERDGTEFCKLYGITEQGNFEGKSIPNQIDKQSGWERKDPRLKKLYDYRLQRTRLHKDDKILLSWNGWAMVALARAGRLLQRQDFCEAAVRIHEFIRQEMRDERDRLYLRYRDGEAAVAGQLEDYAVYALGLLELYRNSFCVEYLEEAMQRAGQMIELFEDENKGGYFMTASDAEALIARPKETYDGAVPSGNSVAAMVLQELAMLTGEVEWQVAADRQLRFLAGAIRDYPSGSSFALLAMSNALYPHRELICVTQNGVPEELTAVLPSTRRLQIMVKNRENGKRLAASAPFTANYPIPKAGSSYYLCENGVCKAPTTSLKQLTGVLNNRMP